MIGKKRYSGILMHISSLPSQYGIGSLGKECIDFINFLHESKQSLWQILPLGPVGYGNSPYQCYSTFAGNPLLISIEELQNQYQFEIKAHEDIDNKNKIDFLNVALFKNDMFEKAFQSFLTGNGFESEEYHLFYEDNKWWLDEYALFMSLKKANDQKAWPKWRESDKKLTISDSIDVNIKKSIDFNKFLQFEFFRQWDYIKLYANEKGIAIVGDLPIYVAADSVDTWIRPELFMLDQTGEPSLLAGVPPDYFSSTGQLWGNPVYNWDNNLKEDFNWWVTRIKKSLKMYDYLRIDHFRGLAGFWAVPSGEKTAENGQWLKAEGYKMLTKLTNEFKDLHLIAEDLGVITDDVIKLKDDFNLPGMKILQFAFDGSDQNNNSIYNYSINDIAYTGTHDNNTLAGWLNEIDFETKKRVTDYLDTNDNIVWNLIRVLWSSSAGTVIVPMQDLLSLDSNARMNTPSTISGNWEWIVDADYNNEKLVEHLRKITTIYGRL